MSSPHPGEHSEDEIQQRLLTDRFIAQGMPREAAAMAARRQFGNQPTVPGPAPGMRDWIRVRRYLPFLLAVTAFAADEQVQRLTERLTQEAAAFRKNAPTLIGTETLQQRAHKDQKKFRLRIGEGAKAADQPEWELRTLVSQYGYTTFADGALHELRQVVSVDGKPVKNKGPQELARIVTTSEEKRKRELLKSFQDYGLKSAVTDFGQIILLFSPRGIERYEFTYRNATLVDGARALVFDYRQIDGPNGLTVVDAGNNAQQIRMEGQVFVRANNYEPMRITLATTQRMDGLTVRHEATVNYGLSPYGTLLPVSMRHREVWDDRMVAENNVRYQDFKPFASQ